MLREIVAFLNNPVRLIGCVIASTTIIFVAFTYHKERNNTHYNISKSNYNNNNYNNSSFNNKNIRNTITDSADTFVNTDVNTITSDLRSISTDSRSGTMGINCSICSICSICNDNSNDNSTNRLVQMTGNNSNKVNKLSTSKQYSIIETVITTDITKKYKVYDTINKKEIKFSDALLLMKDNNYDFIDAIVSTITDFKSQGLFWECTPITKSNYISVVFEYVLTVSEQLATVTVDTNTFKKKFFEQESISKEANSVISFYNLNRDAVLVVPSPPLEIYSNSNSHSHGRSNSHGYSVEHYKHLQSFLRSATTQHCRNLFHTIGVAAIDDLANREKDKKLWISTSGLGVSWLHVRLDTVPKYYNYREYRNG